MNNKISGLYKLPVYIVSLIILLLLKEKNLMNNKTFGLYCFFNHSLTVRRDDFS